jgi:hypothetical protein
MTLEERLAQCNQEGEKAEQHFKRLMEAKGKFVLPSTRDQNIYEHVDFWVDDKGIDVKGNRHLDCIWLELNNVQGKDGWLKGKADYIVFDVVELKQFCFFNRTDLLNYCNNITGRAISKDDFNKLYTRFGRKDLLVKVRYDDIKNLQVGFLSYKHEAMQRLSNTNNNS